MARVPPDSVLDEAKEHRPVYWVLFVLIVFLGIAAFFAANYQISMEYAEIQDSQAFETEPPALVKILIDFGDSKRAFQGESRQGLLVGQALYEMAAVGKIDLELKNDAITRLDGLKSTDKNGRWRLYLNGDILEGGLSRKLLPGDQVTLRYE